MRSRPPSSIERCCRSFRTSVRRGRIWPRSRALGTERRSRATRSPAVYSGPPAIHSLAGSTARPLLIAPVGRAARGLPLGDPDTLEVRRVDQLPAVSELDPARPTVVLVDRRLLLASGDNARHIAELAGIAALIGLGEPGEVAPDRVFPLEFLSSYFAADAPA